MVASEGRQKDWAINPHFRKTCQSLGFMVWIECWPAPKQLAVEQRRGGRRLIGELSFYDLATKYSSLSPEYTHTSQRVHTSRNRLKTQWVNSSQRAHTYQVPTQWVHMTRNRLEIQNDSLISSSVCFFPLLSLSAGQLRWKPIIIGRSDKTCTFRDEVTVNIIFTFYQVTKGDAEQKHLAIWQGPLVIGWFPPHCDNYLTYRCQLDPCLMPNALREWEWHHSFKVQIIIFSFTH